MNGRSTGSPASGSDTSCQWRLRFSTSLPLGRSTPRSAARFVVREAARRGSFAQKLPVGRCVRGSQQVLDGIQAALGNGGEVEGAVVLRPTKSDLSVVGARIKTPTVDFERSAIPLHRDDAMEMDTRPHECALSTENDHLDGGASATRCGTDVPGSHGTARAEN